MTTIRRASILGFALASGCAGPPADNVRTRTIAVTAPVPVPAPFPRPKPTVPPTPCEQHTPGTICTWLGTPGTAAYEVSGTPPRHGLSFPIDVEFGPDGTPYVLDTGNNRVLTVGEDGTTTVLLGVGVIGDGVFDPFTGQWNEGPAAEYKVNAPSALAFDPGDPDGIYVVAQGNGRILRYDRLTTWVAHWAGGGPWGSVSEEAILASEASFFNPSRAVFDDVGSLYVMDEYNSLLRRVDPDGLVRVAAGIPGLYGYNGDGPGLDVTLHAIAGTYRLPGHGLAWVDGQLVFPDGYSQIVRAYDPVSATVTTIAGSFSPDTMAAVWEWDSNHVSTIGVGAYGGDGLPAEYAHFNQPGDVALGVDGEIYVADTYNHCVRVIGADGIVGTAAGRCGERSPFEDFLGETDNIPATDAWFEYPRGVTVDPAGNLLIADTDHHAIRVVWR
jgi:hypothetical protein